MFEKGSADDHDSASFSARGRGSRTSGALAPDTSAALFFADNASGGSGSAVSDKGLRHMAAAPHEVPEADGSLSAVLFEQHARIRGLLGEVRSNSGEVRAEAFEALRRMLASHETAEEIVLRPVSVQIMSRDAAADRNHEERHIVAKLADLEHLDSIGGSRWDELFASFEQAVVDHLAMEEAEEFPVIEAEVDDQELARMANWITRAFELGPTHPHPFVTGHPEAERAAMPFSALADHVRDHFEHTRDEGR